MSKTAKCFALVFAVVAPASSLHADDEDQNTVWTAGISGNLVVIGPGQTSKTSPGLGARAGVVHRGCWDGYGCESLLTRASAEYHGAWHNNQTGKQSIQAAQGRFGIGTFDFGDSSKKALKQIYYMVFTDFNFDGSSKGKEVKSALVSVTGGEIGRQVDIGKESVLFVGVNTGVGVLRASNGQTAVFPPLSAAYPFPVDYKDRNIHATALALGSSVDGRIGKPDAAGTVYLSGTVTNLMGQGFRSNAGADVNVSRHLQVGGGLRQVYIRDSVNGALDDKAPYVRVTLNLGRSSN